MVLFVERRKSRVASSASTGHAGLGIVSQISEGESTNIVVKFGLRSLTRKPIISSLPISSTSVISSNISTNSNIANGDYNCFLRACHMCHKSLRPDKDVYMYRGDQGFCSIKCRNRQIMVDEMKDKEANTRKRVATSLDCRGCETCKLLEELRLRRNHRAQQQHRPILSIS